MAASEFKEPVPEERLKYQLTNKTARYFSALFDIEQGA
jgi:hypothetical protein